MVLLTISGLLSGGAFAIAMIASAVGLPSSQQPVRALIVADELPAMEVLAEQMHRRNGIESRIVRQTELPASLAEYDAVLVYIHGRLEDGPEQAFLAYAENGGKLVLLHHSISSGKRRNQRWFAMLGVELPEAGVDAGGYKWIEGVRLEIANLAPRHFITRKDVTYPVRVAYAEDGKHERLLPGFVLPHSEVYLNHRLTGRRSPLLGLRYVDASGKVWMQATAGWVMKLGKGWVVYFMPGHTADEFREPAYAAIVANAVMWKP
jgi:type 1 glutamine amidotransferase